MTRVVVRAVPGQERRPGPRRRLTFDSASAWELDDRALVRRGFKADLVEFDGQRVEAARPRCATSRRAP